MYNKIDKSLIDKIKTLNNSNDKLDVIIMSNHFLYTQEILKKISSKVIELPFISSFVVSLSQLNLIKIASYDCVNYIMSNSKVCSLIYKSKKFLEVDYLYDKVDNSNYHTVVVVDTGIYPHIDFCLGKNRIIKFLDLINDRDDYYDDNGHGTFIAGVLCANSVTSKYSGIDNNTDIIVIKALNSDGETTSVTILQAMQWIIENKEKYNIKVVCMSFGSIFENVNDPLMKGAEVLWNNGICVVCAAGNNGPEEKTIMSPGTSKKIITVGSLDNLEEGINVAEFSSRGPVFNYYKPDMVVPGVDIISTSVFGNTKKFYTTMTGTSVSAPMVAGIASLLYKINPRYSPDEIKYMLLNSCIKITGDKNIEGYGYIKLSNILK